MAIEKIIVLDDEPLFRRNLTEMLQKKNLLVAQADCLAKAKELVDKDDFDLIFADVCLDKENGGDMLDYCQVKATPPLIAMMTQFVDVESAVTCMKKGAFDYMLKPITEDQVEVLIKKAGDFHQLVRVNQHLSQGSSNDTEHEILGNSPAIQQLNDLIRKVARTQATVLIQGESGTGKELVARSIFKNSTRNRQPFITVNCAAIPDNLVESEFFGHEKGSFTGAVTRREGRFELAHNGTILLDEISEISPVVQSKLLRVLQERELERVGGNRTIKVDTRVIATTNRDLAQSVERKEFRQDLYFRLNVVPINVPPLRERKSDITLLAETFMRRYAKKHGCPVCGFSKAAMDAMMAHNWPGNIRELQNVVERAVILSSEGGYIEPEFLGLTIMSSGQILIPTRQMDTPPEPSPSLPVTPFMPAEQPASMAPYVSTPPDTTEPTPETILPLSELEKQHILSALEAFDQNKTQTAKHLGISIRTLRNKLNDYDKEDHSPCAS
jgi:DNA-binding NtrC family response regulator